MSLLVTDLFQLEQRVRLTADAPLVPRGSEGVVVGVAARNDAVRVVRFGPHLREVAVADLVALREPRR